MPRNRPLTTHEQARVVVAPPDFAPAIDATVSLYDIAFQCGIDKGALTPEARPSFTRHIRPVIERTVALRWVDDWGQWAPQLPLDWDALADPAPASASARAADRSRGASPGSSARSRAWSWLAMRTRA